MASDMVKDAHYHLGNGQNGSIGRQRWSKWLNMTSEMVKMALCDVKDGQKAQ